MVASSSHIVAHVQAQRNRSRSACFVNARPVAQSHCKVLMSAMKMRTCNSCQLLNLLDISLPLLPHGGHVCSDTGQLLPAMDSQWKVGTQNGKLATKRKAGTQSGKLATKWKTWHPTSHTSSPEGGYAAVSRLD